MPIPYFLTILRLIIPLSILRWPFWGALASAYLDLKDWNFINFQKDSDYIYYQNWDKALDLYYLSLALISTRKWKDKKAKNLVLFLFIYRLFGITLFWVTGSRLYLFLFPNFVESFFFFYLLYTMLFKKIQLFTSSKIPIVLGIAIAIPKIAMEYLLHVAQKQIWQIYNLGEKLSSNRFVIDNVNFWFGIFVFYLIPFAVGFLIIRALNKKRR